MTCRDIRNWSTLLSENDADSKLRCCTITTITTHSMLLECIGPVGSTKNEIYFFYTKIVHWVQIWPQKNPRVGLFWAFSNWALCILSQPLHKEKTVKMQFGPKIWIFQTFFSLEMSYLGVYLLSNNIFWEIEIDDKIAILAFFLVHKKLQIHQLFHTF